MKNRNIFERLADVESPNLVPSGGIALERARGSELWDAEGRRYIDFAAGFGVAALGHSHPEVVASIREQSEILIHGMGDVYPSSVKADLLEKLAGIFGEPCRSILGLNGSDAVEAALKTAMLATGRPGVIAFEGAYHGLGYGSLSVTHRADFRRPFLEQLSPHVFHAPFPAADEDSPGPRALEIVESLLAKERVGAVIVEPIQGRGGIRPPAPGFVEGLAKLAHERGALLIVDEILTGLGRTGAWFGFEHEGIRPDIITVGKALGGGLPLSAAIGRAEVMKAWPGSSGEAIHTSTFLGHPLACRAALTTLGVIERKGLVARAQNLERRVREALEEFPLRGRGLLLGIPLASGEAARRVCDDALREGLVILFDGPLGDVVSILPALNIPEDLLNEGLSLLRKALRRNL